MLLLMPFKITIIQVIGESLMTSRIRYVVAFRMQVCSTSNFICHPFINSLLCVSFSFPGSITLLSLHHCSLIAVDGITTLTG